jgi:hypothetical protein
VVPPPITHGLEVTHGLKEIRWLGDGESHPSLNRWLAVAIVDGLEVTHGQGCRSGGDPRQGCRLGLPCRISAGLEVTHGQACRLEVTHGQAHRISVCSVTDCCWKLRQKFLLLVWLLLLEINLGGGCYFWWEVVIKK